MADTSAQPAMEDILTSIRTSMAEETAKVGSGSSDLIDAAAAQDGEDDVLELSADDMVGAQDAASEDDELIDISAFGTSGEAKPVNGQSAADLVKDLLDEGGQGTDAQAETPADADAGAADEFDRLLAEISQEQQQQVAAAEMTKQALMDEEAPLGEEPAAEVAGAEAVAVAETAPVVETPQLAETIEAAAVAELGAGVAGLAPSYSLSTVEGSGGVQVAFPAEVLAMALRPMVQDWLSKNLPGVVEKLVKEEISKLTQN
jgi:uncharacterized protein